MPRGPQRDNVMGPGERYTLDLGVEPSMGNLLSNLEVANDLLDQAEAKFRVIGAVVGSLTQQLSQATRQTALLAAEADRVKGAYQSIAIAASAGATLASIGQAASGVGGGVVGGGGAGPIPGGNALLVPTSALAALAAGGGSPYARVDEIAAEEVDIPPLMGVPHFQWAALANLGYALQLGESTTPAAGAPPGPGAGIAGAIRPGWLQVLRSVYAKTKQAASKSISPLQPLSMMGAGAKLAAEEMGGGVVPKIIGYLGGLAGGLAGSPIWATAGAGLFLYNRWATFQAEARRMTGVTGGTGMLGGPTGGVIPLWARGMLMEKIHPGVPYAEIQMQAAAQGYIGQQYERARDYLFEAFKRGMGTIVDHIDLFEEAVDKAGGSTEHLVSALDGLRTVARNTNSSLVVMTKNFKQNVENLVSMGASGNAAIFGAQMAATSWANSFYGQLNPELRNLGGYNITLGGGNVLLRALTVQQMQEAGFKNVTFANLETQMALNPELATRTPFFSEEGAVEFLKQFGFREGMTPEEIMRAQPNLVLLGPTLAQVLPPGTDFTNPRTLAMAIANTLNRPLQQQLLQARRELRQRRFTPGSSYTPRGVVVSRVDAYLQQLGLSTGGEGHPVAQWYRERLEEGIRLPLFEQIVQGDENATFIKDPETGTPMPFYKFLTKYGERAVQMLQDPSLQIATLTPSQQAALRSARRDKDKLKALWGSVQWSEAQTFVTPQEPSIRQEGGGMKFAGTVKIHPESLSQLARILAAME